MLPLEKHKVIIEQIESIFRRMSHLQQVKNQQFDFIAQVQQLYSSFSQKIHREMLAFEQKVVKNCLYSSEKANYIVNMAKIYREFSIQLQRNSKINVINLQRTKHDQIARQEEKLRKKCDMFIKEFNEYIHFEKDYNKLYEGYSARCNELDELVQRNKSYENPLSFYNQTLTNEYLSELERKHMECTTSETAVITEIQVLDQKRGWMVGHIKEINEQYVILIHNYLRSIEKTIKYIVDPKKEEHIEKGKLNLRASQDSVDNQQVVQLQRLDNLYSSQNGIKHGEDNILQDFSQLFKKESALTEVSNSDYKFFYDRCENIRVKKLKKTQEVFLLQSMLIGQLSKQRENYDCFEKEYHTIQRDIFTNNGVDSFKKRFRKYFGSNFLQIEELCMSIIERQKKSLEKICKSMEDSENKMRMLLDSKRDNINNFNKRSKMILDEHMCLRDNNHSVVDSQDLHRLKNSISQSFNQLKKIFVELEKSQTEIDTLFFGNLKNHYEIILKEAISKNLSRLLEKQKNRVNILKEINVDSEVLLILKQDSRYELLMNECPKPNLYDTFQTRIRKREYEETKILLQKKEKRLKNMIRSIPGCLGLKSAPIKVNILSQHTCKLLSSQTKYKGTLSISSTGLIFEQSSWNPFHENLQLMIPQSDIVSFEMKTVEGRQMVQVCTDFGNLSFYCKQSKQIEAILESMQKNITFKPRQVSERGNRKNDSSSFLKNNTSSEFKISYERTFNASSNQLSKAPTAVNYSKEDRPDKAPPKPKNMDSKIKQFVSKWKQTNFLSECFSMVKEAPIKNAERRDYIYKSESYKFYLKQRRRWEFEGRDVCLTYEWKISFPQSPMLHSFKHSEKVRIENISKAMRIKITIGHYYDEQLYIRSKFYKQIEKMNTGLLQYVSQFFEKEADVLIEQESDENKSMEGCNILVEDIKLQERDSKLQGLRASRLQKRSSSVLVNNSKGSLKID